jgi:hypothetical protein
MANVVIRPDELWELGYLTAELVLSPAAGTREEADR